ncbi:MAG TPA: glycoside hydrolase family 38 C-terminal domain-containing protein, partial [Longimicrobiales bacterium]
MQRRTCFRAFAVMLSVMATASFNTLNAQQRNRPITEWLIAGTFAVDTGATRVRRDYLGGEAAAVAQEGQPAAGVQWRRVGADSLGRVNLNNVLTAAPHDNAAAYAFVYLTAPADRTVQLAVETDDDGVVWLNGTLVYYKEVARGVGEADTIVLRLARGVNRLMYKIVNRSGGFGLGGRLLASSPQRIDDLVIRALKPADDLATGPLPYVTLGTPRLVGGLLLQQDGQLVTVMRVAVTRWGRISEPLDVVMAGKQMAVPAAEGSLPVSVELRAPFADLASAVRSNAASVQARWGRQAATAQANLRAGDLLALLSLPVTTEFTWQGRERGEYRTTIPATLAGLRLALDVAEFLPGSNIRVNGQPAAADSLQQVMLCAACRTGAPLRVEIEAKGKTWWDAPRLLVRDSGWRELVESVRYARILTNDSSIAPPADSIARKLLVLADRSDKTAYHALLDKERARLRPAEQVLRRDTIDLIGNSHIDAAWLWRRPETIEVVRNTWRTAVKLLDKYPEMKFAASAAQYYVWLEQYEPDLLARIQQLVKEGRWILVGGMWVESDVNMPTGESLARQELYGQHTFMRLFGKYATVAWIPDTFGYPWQLPQIFTQAGLNEFVTQKLRWNDTNEWTADHNYFIWRGRDGTALPTYIPFGYDHDLNAQRLAREFRAQADSAATRRLLTLYGVGDHGGGPTMQMLDRRRETDRVPAFPIERDADPAVSLEAMAREAAKPPVIDDELYFEYHRGVQTTQAATKQWNRRMEGLLLAADAAAAVSGAADREAIRNAWQKTLFNQFHDILPGSGIGPVYEDARVDYLSADSLARHALLGAMQALAARLDTRAARGVTPVFVFNPSGRERSGTIKLANAWRAARVLDANGRVLASAAAGDSLTVQVHAVPAVGGTVIFVADGKAARRRQYRGVVLENDSLRVEIDPATGNIAKLFDKRLGRDIVAAGAQANRLMLMNDTPRDWDAWNIDSTNGPWSPVSDSVRIGEITDDGVATAITVERSAPGVHAT